MHKRRYSSDELRNALETVANVVTAYGDVYLPIFLRLEREVSLASEYEDTMGRVKLVASKK